MQAVQPSSSSDSQGEPKESEENLDLPKKKTKKKRTKKVRKAIDYLGQVCLIYKRYTSSYDIQIFSCNKFHIGTINTLRILPLKN